jgi:hypothetical protein
VTLISVGGAIIEQLESWNEWDGIHDMHDLCLLTVLTPSRFHFFTRSVDAQSLLQEAPHLTIPAFSERN